MMDIFIFNVGLGQCIFFYPRNAPEYSLMVDCGHSAETNPVEILHKFELFKNNELGQLIITNYDQDHFSNIDAFESLNISIKTTRNSHNVSSSEIKSLKQDVTTQLTKVLRIKDTYTSCATNHNPPYMVSNFSLTKEELRDANIPITTNNLSQIVFVKYADKTVCIGGDLEIKAWEYICRNNFFVREYLRSTDIFIASHHGRENGYCVDIFTYCKPECVIISDKSKMYSTQDGVVQNYARHVNNGVKIKNNASSSLRKVLTTRNDGTILIRIEDNGNSTYNTYQL